MNFYERLLNKFGKKHQLFKCIDEMYELTQVLLWELNDKGKEPKFIREKVIEEMSDVLMTFESLKLIYNISEKEIKNQINFKENKKIKELFSEDYIECMRCKKFTDIVLRVNPKGQDGIFWCEDCAEEKDIRLSKVINEGEDEFIENMLIERKDQKGKYSLYDLRKKLNKENNFNG